jgi:hypothetical protein
MKTGDKAMMKKAMIAVAGLMFAVMLAAPSKANAAVLFRVGVGPVVVGNAPVVVAPPAPVVVAPALLVAPAPVVVAPDMFIRPMPIRA